MTQASSMLSLGASLSSPTATAAKASSVESSHATKDTATGASAESADRPFSSVLKETTRRDSPAPARDADSKAADKTASVAMSTPQEAADSNGNDTNGNTEETATREDDASISSLLASLVPTTLVPLASATATGIPAPAAAPTATPLLAAMPALATAVDISANAAAAPADTLLPDAGMQALANTTATPAGQASPPAQADNPATAPAPLPLAMSGEAVPLLAGFRELADKLRLPNEPAPVAPVHNPMVGAATASNLLPSTATVNPATLVTPDLHGDQFADDIGTQISWLADQKIGHAHIKINPHELGPVEVSLRLDGDRVHADFSSPQAEVRQALESSLPRLREMLGQHGFQLAQADVGHRQQGQTTSGSRAPGHRGDDTGLGPSLEETAPRPVRILSDRLVDAYA